MKERIGLFTRIDFFDSDHGIMLGFMRPNGILIDLKTAKDHIKKLQETYNKLSQKDILVLNFLQKEYLKQELECSKLQAEHLKKETKGYVYFLKSGKYTKIGRCKNLSDRTTQIKSQLPNSVLLIHAIETNDCMQCEKDFHKKYISKKSNGEWFLLSEADIREVKKIKQRDY